MRALREASPAAGAAGRREALGGAPGAPAGKARSRGRGVRAWRRELRASWRERRLARLTDRAMRDGEGAAAAETRA